MTLSEVTQEEMFVEKSNGPKAESLDTAAFRGLENEELARKRRKLPVR